MVSYIGRHAELYDLFYADKPYSEEVAFVHQCLQKYGLKKTHRLLEIACGTGTHALSLEKFGYEIVATDYSEDMLACARRKGEETNSSIKFRLQDMLSLDILEKPFDAIICLFDSIGYAATNENIAKVLKGVHNHLRPGGLFIFEFWHAAAMLRNYEPIRLRRWQVPNGEILRISETCVDHKKQLCHVTYSIYELHTNGRYQVLKETQVNRFFLLQEMAQFLECAGFSLLKWFSGYQDKKDVNADTWHIVAVASCKDL